MENLSPLISQSPTKKRALKELAFLISAFLITSNKVCDNGSFMFQNAHSNTLRICDSFARPFLGLIGQICIAYQPFFAVFFSLIKSFH